MMFYPPATWRRGTSTILMGKSSRRRLSIAMITRGYSLVNIQKAIENGHGNEIYPSKMVIFHSYVAVYQRVVTSYNNSMWFKRQSWCDLASGHLFSSSDWNGPLIPEMVILSFLSVSSLCVRLPLTYTPFTSVNDTISRAKLWLKHFLSEDHPPLSSRAASLVAVDASLSCAWHNHVVRWRVGIHEIFIIANLRYPANKLSS